ncbi:MAG: cold shock domain-containing protein [Rhodospirillaceae bacterium]
MMRKDKGFRGPRRRGFDDDVPFVQESRGSKPPPRPAATFSRGPAIAEGPAVGAIVKWFNGEKGFGFAELEDGSGDAFLHIGALQAAGYESVAPGTKLSVNVGQGAKGPQITRVMEVDESTAAAAPASSAPRSGPPRTGAPRGPRQTPDPSTAVSLSGTVKWFNSEKGFGFVASETGGKDVFVHVSVLGAAGLTSLPEGQRVTMRVVETAKGREAVSISLA